jgi:protein involved in polysaccharide export with SLBB domain
LGDLIEIDVIGSFEFDWRGTISPEGFLSGINFVESPIYALCRSEEEIAAEVFKAYSKFLREPQIVVKILDRSNRPISVMLGAVKNPQRFQIRRAVYLNELLILSGGLTDKTSGEIQIFRPQNLSCKVSKLNTTNNGQSRERFVGASQDNGSQYINIRITDLLAGKKEANPQILNGDIITVFEARSVYVIGGVANPRRISFRNEITLSRAIDSAGGLAKNADAKKITIFRRETGETKIIEADLEKIRAKQADDIILKPFDIVEVTQEGGERRKIPPIVGEANLEAENPSKLPLRVID